MKFRLPGDRPVSPESRAGIGAAVALLLVITVVEVADGEQPHFIGLYAAVPFLAAAWSAWPAVLAVGLLASVVGFVIGMYPSGLTAATGVNLAGVVIATGVACVVGT